MTEIKSEGGQSYTIPLESIDLKYLSKYVRTTYPGKRPLWTRKCLNGESEYCHIQIDSQNDNEDCYSEETFDTFNCHICNVEVPVLCFKRHNESDKHVTLKTIFQKVLERVSKQINTIVINNDKDIDKDVYYCVPCSKIIKIENKRKHESSAYHVKSQKGIDVMHEFYKTFEEIKAHVGPQEVENEEILDETRFGTEIIQNDDTKNNNVKVVTNEEKCNNDETKTIPTSTVEHVKPNNKHNEEITSDENYFKDMVKKYKMKVNLPVLDGEFIHVTSPIGVKVRISQDHFHSYRSIVEGIRVYCQMCKEPVELGEESKHKVSQEHARNIFLPINEEFARTLNDYTSHCLICNKVILTSRLSDHHLNNDNHVKLLNSTKLTDICEKNEDLANGINTENNIEETHSENHANKTEENKIIKCINNKECTSKVNLSENYLSNGHIAITKDVASVEKLVFCKLCNVSVPQDQMEYHNAGTPHWSNAFRKICTGVTERLQTYFSGDNLKTDSDSSEIQNDTPKETLKNDNVASTSVSNISNNKIDSSGPFRYTDSSSEIQNDTPNDTLKNDNIASTSVSNISNNKIDSSGPFRYTDSTKNKIACIVCDIDIVNVLQSIKKHEASSNHKLWLRKLLNFHTIKKNSKLYFCECCCDTSVTNIWTHMGSEQHTALLQLEFEIDSKALKFYNYKSNIRNTSGIMSRELYKMLLETNKVYKLQNSHFYCTFCEVELSGEGKEIDHMFSAAHESWLRLIFKSH